MNPTLINLGPIEIRYYGILMALAFLTGYFIFKKIAKEKNINAGLIDSYFIWVIISMILGARLFEAVFYEPAYYLASPLEIFYIWHGGLASHGAILGAIIMTYIFTRKHRLSFYALADIVVIPCALGAAFVRVGNFINGEIVGKTTGFFTAVKFDGYEGLRHPVQLYEAFVNLIIFAVLYNFRKLKLKQGYLFWAFIFIYSVFRFVTELFKDMPRYFGLTLGQWFSVVLIIISAVFFSFSFLSQSRHRRE